MYRQLNGTCCCNLLLLLLLLLLLPLLLLLLTFKDFSLPPTPQTP